MRLVQGRNEIRSQDMILWDRGIINIVLQGLQAHTTSQFMCKFGQMQNYHRDGTLSYFIHILYMANYPYIIFIERQTYLAMSPITPLINSALQFLNKVPEFLLVKPTKVKVVLHYMDKASFLRFWVVGEIQEYDILLNGKRYINSLSRGPMEADNGQRKKQMAHLSQFIEATLTAEERHKLPPILG